MRTSGQEVLNMRNRMNDYDRMNNVSPVEKQLVGPGLGVDPSVPSFGGYQQILRVNPENVGAYKLTTLPGRTGPAHDTKGGRRGIAGALVTIDQKRRHFSRTSSNCVWACTRMSGVTGRGKPRTH